MHITYIYALWFTFAFMGITEIQEMKRWQKKEIIHYVVQHISPALQGQGSPYFKKRPLVCNATQLRNAMNSLEPSCNKHFASKFKHFL